MEYIVYFVIGGIVAAIINLVIYVIDNFCPGAVLIELNEFYIVLAVIAWPYALMLTTIYLAYLAIREIIKNVISLIAKIRKP